MAKAINAANKETWQYVRIAYGDSPETVVGYTDRDSDDNFAGDDYDSTPSLEVKQPKNDGLLGDQDLEIYVPLVTDAFSDAVSNGLPLPPMRVSVVEKIQEAGKTTSYNTRFIGQVRLGARNVRGDPELVKILANSIKNRIQNASMGFPCDTQCINVLGDQRTCKVDMSINNRTLGATISAIDGMEVTVNMGAIPDGLGDRFYQFGYISRNGLSLMIQDWRDEVEGNKRVFFMMRQPPASWLGAAVVLKSGCDKSVQTCRARYDNEDNIKNPGFALPPYHPIYENGGEYQN